jgi:Helix-turn-helix domain
VRQNTRVTFAMRDLDRLKCIQAVVDGDLKPHRAAERLGLTSRQVRRLARRYAAAGSVGLISKRFSRPSNNRLADDTADRSSSCSGQRTPILDLPWLPRSSEPSMASISPRRLCGALQIAVGLWIPRKPRPPKIQQPRLRRACIDVTAATRPVMRHIELALAQEYGLVELPGSVKEYCDRVACPTLPRYAPNNSSPACLPTAQNRET